MASFAIVVIVLSMLSGQAMATIITVDDPVVTGSFEQKFHLNTGGILINRFETNMISSASAFKGGGAENFSDSTWFGSLVTPGFAAASGKDTDILDFNLHFDGTLTNPLDFIFTSFFDKDIKEEWHVSYDGSGHRDGWHFDDCSKQKVPEPTSLLLFGMGLLGFGILRRKITR